MKTSQPVTGYGGRALEAARALRQVQPRTPPEKAGGLTEILARALRERGHDVEVEHLHVHLPAC
ncbi:hypothetical protein [Streptomyces sp. CT34]|uniref:hypothetical protein n=1 Tax=Streptomyces sp. CT34 TaxID=1553907 RepID=UPI00099D49FF|nr:hypothetical protein [Streptomyces sp. CT34]